MAKFVVGFCHLTFAVGQLMRDSRLPVRIVAEALAEAKHPEAKEALELQNRLIAEAIRIHDHSVVKKQ